MHTNVGICHRALAVPLAPRKLLLAWFPRQGEGHGRCAKTRSDARMGSNIDPECVKRLSNIVYTTPARFCPQICSIHVRNHTYAARPRFMSTRAGRHRKILDQVVCENTFGGCSRSIIELEPCCLGFKRSYGSMLVGALIGRDNWGVGGGALEFRGIWGYLRI